MIEWLRGMNWQLTWFGWWCLGSVVFGWLFAPVLARRLTNTAQLGRPDLALPALPCDGCDRLVAAGWAHAPHDPDCGFDDRGWCRCDNWRCPSCCPCDIVKEEHHAR